MKKWSILVLMACLVSFLSVGAVSAAENSGNPTKPSLTDQQKAELAAMHTEVMEKEKAIIAKYVEYGVLSQQAADMLTNHMNKRFEKIKENGYIPPHHFGKMHPGKPPHENSPDLDNNQ